jgi:hypothetical protein
VARRLRDREVAAHLWSAKAEAIYIVLTSDVWREIGEQPDAGHSAIPRARDLTNRPMCTSIKALC